MVSILLNNLLDPHTNCELTTSKKLEAKKNVFYRQSKYRKHNRHHKSNSN
jgi:hypothetical protein